MKKLNTKQALLLFVVTSVMTSNAFAAGYIKLGDIKGESVRYAEIEVRQGQLLLVGEDGRTTRLQKDGTYRTTDNQVFVVKNGLVQTPHTGTPVAIGNDQKPPKNMAPNIGSAQKISQQNEPKPKPGQNIQSNQPEENAALLLPAVQKVRE